MWGTKGTVQRRKYPRDTSASEPWLYTAEHTYSAVQYSTQKRTPPKPTPKKRLDIFKMKKGYRRERRKQARREGGRRI